MKVIFRKEKVIAFLRQVKRGGASLICVYSPAPAFYQHTQLTSTENIIRNTIIFVKTKLIFDGTKLIFDGTKLIFDEQNYI